MCGKSFDKGARIFDENVYCPSCWEEIEEVLDKFEVEFMEAKLYKKSIPDINEYMDKHRDVISKSKIPVYKLKLMLLRRCIDINRLETP